MRHGKAMVMLVLLLSLLGCQSAEEKAKHQREEQKHQEAARVDRDIASMTSRSNAIVDWPQQLNGLTFTIDVEPVFVRADHRPTFFYASLKDIKRSNDAIILYFITIPVEGEPTLQLTLDCNGCDLLALKNSEKNVGDFGVVAQITAADKSLDDAEDAPNYVMHGKFIDARFIGDYALDKLLASPPGRKTKSE
jgi:hypothetical protein